MECPSVHSSWAIWHFGKLLSRPSLPFFSRCLPCPVPYFISSWFTRLGWIMISWWIMLPISCAYNWVCDMHCGQSLLTSDYPSYQDASHFNVWSHAFLARLIYFCSSFDLHNMEEGLFDKRRRSVHSKFDDMQRWTSEIEIEAPSKFQRLQNRYSSTVLCLQLQEGLFER